MRPTPIVIVGAGGFGRETLDVVTAINIAADNFKYEVLGVVDSAPSSLNIERLEARKTKYVGTEEDWFATGREASFVIAIGDPVVRATVAERWSAFGLGSVSLIHPRAVVGTGAEVGQGTVICSGAQVSTNVRIGAHTHINPNATIGHDTVLGNFVSVNPGAVVSGDVSVADLSLIGAGAVILQGLTIGKGGIVGAAACVTRDVKSGDVVTGVPARKM